MQNRRLIYLALILVGCSRQPESVFVDLDMVVLNQPKPGPASQLKPENSIQALAPSRSIPGEAASEIENLKADEKIAIRKEVDKETNDAIATISKRLVDYYGREIDDFYKVQFAKLVPLKQTLDQELLVDSRKIFEKSARRRAPVLTRLTFLTKFPPTIEQTPVGGTSLVDPNPKKTTEIQDLKRLLVEIDRQFEDEMDKLDQRRSSKLVSETDNILTVISSKQKEIDAGAVIEATNLVKRFSTGITSRIFSKYTFQLKEIPTKTVNFPKMPAQPGIPRVTFQWNQLNQDDKIELTKELEAFLSLNHYRRVTKVEGAKDVTKEFIEWRTNLKSGHWENWQKSSAQK